MTVVNKKLDVGINARSVFGQIKNLYKLIIKIIYYIFMNEYFVMIWYRLMRIRKRRISYHKFLYRNIKIILILMYLLLYK